MFLKSSKVELQIGSQFLFSHSVQKSIYVIEFYTHLFALIQRFGTYAGQWFHCNKFFAICCCSKLLLPLSMRKPDFPQFAKLWPVLHKWTKPNGLPHRRSTDMDTATVDLSNHILFNLDGCISQGLAFSRLDHGLCLQIIS